MIEKLKRIHYMFYASLVFMGFPFISILLGEVPYWHFFLALLFIASYLGVLITENKKLTWICWLYLLAYVAGNTLFINANYFWFYFFISNLLVYHFEIRMPSKMPRSISCWQKTSAIGLAAICMTV